MQKLHTFLTPTPFVLSPDHCKLLSFLPLLLSTPEPESCIESKTSTENDMYDTKDADA